MEHIPYAHQYIDSYDIKEVVKALKSDWLTQGPMVEKFEAELSKHAGARYAVALSSGTAALHLSMMALGVSKGDKVITSPITFSASANCALYVGAKPVFIDIDDKTYHLDLEKLKSFLKNSYKRKRIRAIVPVHLMGTLMDMVELKNICAKYGINIVEDAAHALGAKYKFNNRWINVGACKHSDITIFSFHPIKHITTGEGGALLTNNKNIYEKVKKLRHHGIHKSFTKPSLYDVAELGFNYRLSDFQCALGSSQLKKLKKMVDKRRVLVDRYNKAFSQIKRVRTPYERTDTHASYHLYVVRVPGNLRDALIKYLHSHKIYTQINYIPVYQFSLYKNMGYKTTDFVQSQKYYKEALSLPLYVGLTPFVQSKIIKCVKDFFKYN